MNWNIEMLRMRARELEVAADELEQQVEEEGFVRWRAETLFPQAVEHWLWGAGL